MPQQWVKDPEAVLDYTINWATWLGMDTIATSAWTVPSGLTKQSDSKTGTTTTLWLSGGALGQRYEVTNRITTAGGRTEDRSIWLTVQHK